MPYLDPGQTDRGRQAPFSGGPKHDSAIKFGMSPYLWGANWRSGHHISKPATARHGARQQKWITPLWPIILLRLGAVVARLGSEQSCPPNAANSPPCRPPLHMCSSKHVLTH